MSGRGDCAYSAVDLLPEEIWARAADFLTLGEWAQAAVTCKKLYCLQLSSVCLGYGDILNHNHGRQTALYVSVISSSALCLAIRTYFYFADVL